MNKRTHHLAAVSVIPSAVACRAVALCEGWEGSRRVSFKFTSPGSLDVARDDECLL